MSTIVVLAGSPSVNSRTAALTEHLARRLREHGHQVRTVRVRDLPAEALLSANASDPRIAEVVDAIAAADGIVVASPVYKAAYSGVLKVFLDLLPQSALKGKTVLPLATGGSPHHMLALDYALRPVLQSLAARHILPGVYATDGQVTLQPEGAYQLQADLAQRLDDAVEALANEGLKLPPTSGFEPVAFSRVRCSV
jgi:FMN reductase